MSENTVTPYQGSTDGKKQQVTKMFNTISETYDGLNRVISWGSDVKWRKFVVQKVAEINPSTVLDVATGTGDLAIALTTIPEVKITGLDISEGMLAVGREKIAKKQEEQKNVSSDKMNFRSFI